MKRSLLAVLFSLVLSAAAQEQAPPQLVDPQAGPVEPESQAPAQAEYSGPTILSRGGAPSVGRGSELFRIVPFVHVGGAYDSGLAAPSVDWEGRLGMVSAWGVETDFGVLGRRVSKRTAVDLDYRGSYRHYTRHTYYDGMDNSLMLGVQHRLSRRVSVALQETAARYQRAFFLPMQNLMANDPLVANMVGTDMFDNPTFMLSSTARFIYQRTARLSFSGAGTGLVARRRSAALIGVTGAIATGDIAYRLSRFQTISVQYDYFQLTFQNLFGSSYGHSAALNYAVRLGRNWEVSLRAGGYRLESTRERQVQLDPAIAAILGVSVGVETFHSVVYLPRYDAQITRRFRRGSISGTYMRLITPGNGVYLTSASENIGGSLNYSLTRRFQAGASGYRVMYRSLSLEQLGKYYGYSAIGSISHQIARSLSLTVMAGLRQYSAGELLNRTTYQLRGGLTWAPGERPVALW